MHILTVNLSPLLLRYEDVTRAFPRGQRSTLGLKKINISNFFHSEKGFKKIVLWELSKIYEPRAKFLFINYNVCAAANIELKRHSDDN